MNCFNVFVLRVKRGPHPMSTLLVSTSHPGEGVFIHTGHFGTHFRS